MPSFYVLPRLHRILSVAIFFVSVSGYSQIHHRIIESSKAKTFDEVVKETEQYYSDKDKGKGSGYKQFKRWEYFHRLFVRKDETVQDFTLRRYEQHTEWKRSRSNARIGGAPNAANWKAVGPTRHERENYIGRINTVVVDPVIPHYIYAGSPAGGLWHSKDDGETWICLTDNIYSLLGVSSIVIDPLSPVENRTLYIMTGDKDNYDTNFAGIFRSTDNGTSWTKMPYAVTTFGFNKLMMHPTNNMLLFATTSDGIFRLPVGSSIATKVLTGDFDDMEFNPANPAILYVTGPSGTFRSTDTGGSWTKTASAIPFSGRIEMAVTPADSKIVYLFLGQREVASLYKSVDSGVTYAKVVTNFDFGQVAMGQWRYDLAIAISPIYATDIYLGGIYFYSSSNGGTSWNSDYMGHVDHHSLDFYHGKLYSGNDGGISRKARGAGMIEDLSQGFSVSQIYKIGVDQTAENHILAGLQDNGTSSIVGEFAVSVSDGDGMECFVDPGNPDNIFTSSQTGVFYRGSRSTRTYRIISPPVGPRYWLSPFKMDPSNRNVIYAGYAELWKNTNQGDGSWINISRGALGVKDPIADFAIAPSNSNYIYVFKSDSAFRTTNGGATWTHLKSSLLPWVEHAAIHAENPNTLWIVKPFSDPQSRGPRVLKSTDGGISWADVSGNLPFVAMTSIVYQQGSNNGLYVGSEVGVFYKDDSMADWIPFDYGMPFAPITDLEINYVTGKLYAATYGRGAWQTDLYGKVADGCDLTGKIKREVWTGVSGTDVSAIPVNSPPSSVVDLTSFESPANQGSDFGARVRGYVCVPVSGNYVFWIASDDKSELWLSNSDDPAGKVKIASVTNYTSARQWTKYAAQQSVPITLVKGKKYYIEALHKEAAGSDHLAVGWQLPDGTLERPIPGNRLVAFAGNTNRAPEVSIASPLDGTVVKGRELVVDAQASDADNNLLKVEFFLNGQRGGEDREAPFRYATWTADGEYTVTAKATDREGLSTQTSVDITFEYYDPCYAEGKIRRDVWYNIPGTSISSVPVEEEPDDFQYLTLFESPSNTGTDYASRLMGFVCVPESGYYTFWISSDDQSELRISMPDDPFSTITIASVTGYTAKRQWDKYASQKSQPIWMEAGGQYYIEALHKEASGQDHLAVGWQLADGTMERPIPGTRLSPYDPVPVNNPPVVRFTKPVEQTFGAPANITVEAEAYDDDPDDDIALVELFVDNELVAEFNGEPYVYEWTSVAAGEYEITVIAYDTYYESVSKSMIIFVEQNQTCSAAGNISYERWSNVPGTTVSSIPVNAAPSTTGTITKFEMPSNTGTDFGTRVSGYICAPATGSYTFWIASDDQSELWLSTDNTREKKVRIASVTGHTKVYEWTRYPAQTSPPIMLEAGRSYYIEALHKEGSGVDHLAVGWQLPDGTQERPVAGSRLSPFLQAPSAWQYAPSAQESISDDIAMFPNPFRGGILTLELPVDVSNDHSIAVARVEIVSASGRMVVQSKFACNAGCASLKVPLEEKMPAGIYLVTTFIERRRFVKKLMVE